jgi:hypothetical protein
VGLSQPIAQPQLFKARKIIGAAELGQDPAQERREAREVKPDTDLSGALLVFRLASFASHVG